MSSAASPSPEVYAAFERVRKREIELEDELERNRELKAAWDKSGEKADHLREEAAGAWRELSEAIKAEVRQERLEDRDMTLAERERAQRERESAVSSVRWPPADDDDDGDPS